MFSLTPADEEAILMIKINEIEISDDYSKKDKEQITRYYKRQMRASKKRRRS